MDQSEMIDFYEELVENLHQLHDDIPRIKAMYGTFQDDIKKQQDSLLESIDKAKEVIRLLCYV